MKGWLQISHEVSLDGLSNRYNDFFQRLQFSSCSIRSRRMFEINPEPWALVDKQGTTACSDSQQHHFKHDTHPLDKAVYNRLAMRQQHVWYRAGKERVRTYTWGLGTRSFSQIKQRNPNSLLKPVPTYIVSFYPISYSSVSIFLLVACIRVYRVWYARLHDSCE